MLERFEAWLAKWGMPDTCSFGFLTDGPWDLRDFFQRQCLRSGIRVRPFYRHWINLRAVRALDLERALNGGACTSEREANGSDLAGHPRAREPRVGCDPRRRRLRRTTSAAGVISRACCDRSG